MFQNRPTFSLLMLLCIMNSQGGYPHMDEVTVTKYAKKIYGFAYSRTKNAADAEDLSQTILLELFRIDIRAEDLADPDGYVWRVC
ncbi:MAG: hypothetical protein IJ302_06925, partial [Clostridia bacterium]|nr:hypothetical protein [Clostridia bacterium]